MKKTIFALAILLFLAACKYEDGPLISLRSKHNRLDGTWKFKEVLVDEIDSTSAYQQQFTYISIVSGEDLWNAYMVDAQIEFHSDSNYTQAKGWFNKNKTLLHISFLSIFTWSFGFIGGYNEDWEVLKLSNNNLWFKTNYNNRTYLFKLHRIGKY